MRLQSADLSKTSESSAFSNWRPRKNADTAFFAFYFWKILLLCLSTILLAQASGAIALCAQDLTPTEIDAGKIYRAGASVGAGEGAPEPSCCSPCAGLTADSAALCGSADGPHPRGGLMRPHGGATAVRRASRAAFRLCRVGGGRLICDHDPNLQLRRARLPRRGRSAHRPR